jgi:crotonobetainyl-CoA:carnitine CoA-transferase CaiB-like acyl-CoA transferase
MGLVRNSMAADGHGQRPLDGIRVIDMSHYAAGPVAAMVLGDLGADVIKIEGPHGESGRRMGRTFPAGWSTFFLAVSRNKRFVSIDYKTPDGQELIRDLVRSADVFLENARPGAWDAYGLDHESLRALNPRLVYASVSGFGSEGPMRDWLSMDLIAQAAGGIMGITGSPESGPARVGAAIVDVMAGRMAAFGVVTALYQRERTGEGQRIETSLFATAVSMLSMREVEYQFTGSNPPLTGTAHGQITPAQAFRTKDGRMVMLCCYDDPHFARLARAAGHEEILADERFASNVARHNHHDEIVKVLEEIILERTEAEWTELLAGQVPYTPVLEFDQLWNHPQLEANQLVMRFDVPGLGEVRTVGNPISFSAADITVRRPPGALGADTVSVLREQGLSADRIRQLEEKGIIATTNHRTEPVEARP